MSLSTDTQTCYSGDEAYQQLAQEERFAGHVRPEGDICVIITIREEFVGLVKAKLEKFSKIARRHGQVLEIIHTQKFTKQEPHKVFGARKLVDVPYVRLGIQVPTLIGEQRDIIAHFERAEDGVSFYTHLFDDARRAEAESYIPRLGECDHCHTRRRRNELFVCQTSEGVKVVGSDCLKDYLGISPLFAVEMLKFVGWVNSVGSEDYDEDRPRGWTDRTKGTLETTFVAQQCYRVAKRLGGYARHIRDQFRLEASILINGRGWNKETQEIFDSYEGFEPELDLNALADYVYSVDGDFGANLRLAFSQDYVTDKRVNIIAAAVGLFVGKAVKVEKAALPPAKLLSADPKARVDLCGTVLRTTPYTSDYGPACVIAIRCDDGSNLVHFYSGQAEIPETGKKYAIRATVKKHVTDQRSGEPQTIITRAVYTEPQGDLLGGC